MKSFFTAPAANTQLFVVNAVPGRQIYLFWLLICTGAFIDFGLTSGTKPGLTLRRENRPAHYAHTTVGKSLPGHSA
ncbi:hypothetical protein [Nibrella viscosa]|uniref:hypothetical protein n=1 Tax=Nibrella viscosa TaxID=1084524 RepID=UPI0031EDEC08